MGMVRTITVASFLVVPVGTALAQTPDYLSQNRAAARQYYARQPSNGVNAKDRCGGVSYGTGARTCGTATGGPVGGINGRN